MAASESSKRIVLATFGSPGDLRPFLAVGGELRRRGHEVVVATSPYYRETVEAVGFAFAPVRPDRLPGQQDPDFFARLVRGRERPGAIFREMFLPSLRESVDDLLPIVQEADGVVAHTLAAGARLAAEVARTPWVSAVMQPMGFLSAHEPPVVGPGWVAGTLRLAGPRATRRVFALARRLTDGWAADWHALRQELGLPPAAEHPLWEGQHSPRRSLGLFPHPLGGVGADWPPQARVTGFPFFEESDELVEPDLERFLTAGPPPIVFTLGTTAVNDPGSFYEESAAAARALRRRAVLIGSDGARFHDPDNGLLAVPYASHRLLFPRSAAIVHQGGIGTLAEAMRAGKPMLIMPYAHDQADNAWRANRIGIARVLPRRRYRGDEVEWALGRMLADARIRAAARVVARQVALERGAAVAAELIVSVLESELVRHGGRP